MGKRKTPPMQPIVHDHQGVVRFQKNLVVDRLLMEASERGFNLNHLTCACYDAPKSDWEQFAQLIGYSVSGFGDLPYARRRTIERADAKADLLQQQPAAPASEKGAK